MNKEVDISEPKFRAVIAGTGSYVPEKILTNEELSKMVDTSDEWITTRTGIKERHITTDEQTTTTLAVEAAKKALAETNIKPEELDMIIVATITPEMVFPSTACFVQAQLKAKNAFAFDLSAACSGFTYAISIVQNFIESGRYKNALVIGAETLSKITNWKDRKSCILFGDGAGAIIFQAQPNNNKGVLYSTMSSDGSSWQALNCQAHGSRYPATRELEDPSMVYMDIKGREVYQQAIRRIIQTIHSCLKKNNLKLHDIDMIVSHQMNARIIESVMKRIKLPEEKMFMNIEKFGNTSAASIPIAFDDCLKQGKIKDGDMIIFVAFGAGLTWGANLIKF